MNKNQEFSLLICRELVWKDLEKFENINITTNENDLFRINIIVFTKISIKPVLKGSRIKSLKDLRKEYKNS